MCEEYNGWTNRETWAVALYINNDQGWQESVFEALRGTFDGQIMATADAAGQIIRSNVEELLDPSAYRDEYGDRQPEALTSVLYDIGSLYRVNWDEIGANFLTALTEDDGS